MRSLVILAVVENIYKLPVQLLADGRAISGPAAAINPSGLVIYWPPQGHKCSNSFAPLLCSPAHVRECSDHEVNRVLPQSPPNGEVGTDKGSDDGYSGGDQCCKDCWIHVVIHSTAVSRQHRQGRCLPIMESATAKYPMAGQSPN